MHTYVHRYRDADCSVVQRPHVVALRGRVRRFDKRWPCTYVRCGERGPSNRVRIAVCGAGCEGLEGNVPTSGLVRESGLRYLAFRCYWVGSSSSPFIPRCRNPY